MAFTLDRVVPWGRSFAEYAAMFDLSESDLRLRVLGCGDGPAAFNATLSRRGGKVVSLDPIYVFDTAQIRRRIAETYETVLAQLRENKNDYVWESIRSVQELGLIRMAAMEEFLVDYETGKEEGRYISGELPMLPFADGSFDLALSSHFLFLYSNQLTEAFHLQALKEMLRAAHEVRVFPLLALDGKRSVHLDFVTKQLESLGYHIGIKRVTYEFQRGGNEMLTIRSS